MVTMDERIGRLEESQTHLATKADVAELRAEIARSEARMTALVSQSVAQLSAQIAQVETRMMRWTVALVLGGMTAIAGLTVLITKLLD